MSFIAPSPASISYSHITSETEFYTEVDRVLSAPLRVPTAFQQDHDGDTQHHAAVFEKLETFVHLMQGCYDRFLDQQYNVDYCSQRLIATDLFVEHRQEMATCLVDLSHRSTKLQALLVSYDLLLAFGQHDSSIYLSLHGDTTSARDKITRLVHQIWAGHYAAMADARLRGPSHDVQHEEPGWGGAHFDGDDGHDGARETSQGHPMARRVVSPMVVAESSDAARTRTHQIRLREKAIQLLYEASRVQRLEPVDMRAIDEKFISHLFDLVELTRSHEDEAFNYLLIKLIVALNEQFMVTAISAAASQTRSASSAPSGKNTVIVVLKSRLHVTKTFGENVIFMLNRASNHSSEDHCMQLLVLKLLYLLFTMKETAHYFYTNDLKVLVDVFIRELSDLPEDNESLRHTYLRVFHPLLTNTQLATTPYKRPQIRRLLRSMTKESLYRGEVSSTTRRLVQRCLEAEWCQELDRLDPDFKPVAAPTKTSSNGDAVVAEVPASASAAERLHPSTVLDAPRFRAVSARSAPNTPPPPPPAFDLLDDGRSAKSATAMNSAALPSPAVAVEDEAAMALADAKTTTEREHDPSWQSQIDVQHPAETAVESGAEESAPATRASSRSEFLSPHQHRPIPRRASHNEFRQPSPSSSSLAGKRRPPPAPPVAAGSTTTASRSSSDLSALEGDTPSTAPAGMVLPHVQLNGDGEEGAHEAAKVLVARQLDDELDQQQHSSSARARAHRSMSSSPASHLHAESHDEAYERMSRSLESLSCKNGAPSSSGSSSAGGAGKQRRAPPAPPSATSSYGTSMAATQSAEVVDEDEGQSSEPSDGRASSIGKADGKRRRPPPPPVNRATKSSAY